MDKQKIRAYLKNEIVVKSADSKTIIRYLDSKILTGYFLNKDQDIEQSLKNDVWKFRKEDGKLIEFKGNEVESLKVK